MDHMTVSAKKDCYEDVMEFIFSKLKKEADLYPSPEKVIKDIRLACEEVFVNIASYAYPSGKGEVDVGCEIVDGEIFIIMKDNGVPFNPFDYNEPDVNLAMETRSVGGLGIYIARKIMDDINYNRNNGHNILTLKKKISKQPVLR